MHYFRPYEALGDIGVDRARRSQCRRALAKGPSMGVVLAGGEESDKAQGIVNRLDKPHGGRLFQTKGGQEFRLIRRVELGYFLFDRRANRESRRALSGKLLNLLLNLGGRVSGLVLVHVEGYDHRFGAKELVVTHDGLLVLGQL